MRRQRLPWAELLRRSFALDILVCGKCGGRRRVLAYLTEPSVVRAILEHSTSPARPIAPARDPPQARFVDLSA